MLLFIYQQVSKLEKQLADLNTTDGAAAAQGAVGDEPEQARGAGVELDAQAKVRRRGRGRRGRGRWGVVGWLRRRGLVVCVCACV